MKKIAVIMSGGVLPGGELPDYVAARCDYFLKNQDCYDVVIMSSSFTLNVRLKLDKNNMPISEATSGCAYLKRRDCQKLILCEQFSHDTIASIFFILDFYAMSFGANEVAFITSDFHVQRVTEVSNFIRKILNMNNINISVIGTIAPSANPERAAREEQSLSNFKINYKNVTDRGSFLRSLLVNHRNYNCEYAGSQLDNHNMAY